MRWFVVTLVSVCVLAACAAPAAPAAPAPTPEPPTPDPCDAATIRAYGEQMRPLLRDYLDQVEIALSTARIALGPVLQGMAPIERALLAPEPPDCQPVQAWRRELGEMVDLYRSALRAFAAGNDAQVSLAAANRLRSEVRNGVNALAVGSLPAEE